VPLTAFAAPNPTIPGSKSLTIYLPPGTSSNVKVRALIYNLSGELAGVATNDPGAPAVLVWQFKDTDASGIYLIHLTARDSKGRSSSKTLKAALLR